LAHCFWDDLMQGNNFSTVPRYFYVVVTQKPKSGAVLSARHYSNYGKLDTHPQIQLAPPCHTQSVASRSGEALFDSGISLEIRHDDEFLRHHSNPMPVLSTPDFVEKTLCNDPIPTRWRAARNRLFSPTVWRRSETSLAGAQVASYRRNPRPAEFRF
jgi:hypothetical protein